MTTERLNLEEARARVWPEGAVIRDNEGDIGVLVRGEWLGDGCLSCAPVEVVFVPAPEPDHSMCAQLVPWEPINGHEQWALVVPAGDAIMLWRRHEVERMGFAIPDPEPTVVERAAHRMYEVSCLRLDDAQGVAQALAEAGLLREDAS